VNPITGREVPGPGSYNLEKESIAYRNLEKMTQGMFSSGFQSSQSPSNVDKKSLYPGPGHYNQ